MWGVVDEDLCVNVTMVKEISKLGKEGGLWPRDTFVLG